VSHTPASVGAHGALLCIVRSQHAAGVEALAAGARAAGLAVLLWALDEPSHALRGSVVGSGPGPRVQLLNRLWNRAAAAHPERVLVCDDDVRFERGDLGRFLQLAAVADLHIAQPAHVAGSHTSHAITRRARLSRVRRTSFVELGPVVLVRRPWLDAVFPLPEDFGMGWGVDLLWRDLAREGCRLGIVDAVGIRHLAPAGSGYDVQPERKRMRAQLRARGLRDPAEAQRVVDVWRPWQRSAPWRRTTQAPAEPRAPIPVVLAIDVEPDPRHVSRAAPEPWLGYAASFELFERLRARIAHVTGCPARFTWCFRMDPQVAESYGSATFALDHAPARIETFERHGDALGIHVHPFRWLEDEALWMGDYGNPDWVDHCVDVSLEAFRKGMGRDCLISRFGDAWMDTRTLCRLAARGIRVELGLEPGLSEIRTGSPDERHTGSLADCGALPREPYRAGAEDFRVPDTNGSRPLWVLPLSSALLRPKPRPGEPGPATSPRGRQPLSMWARWSAPNGFGELVTRALAEQPRPYLAFGVRTDLAIRPRVGEAFAAALQALLSHPERRRFVFCGPEEALARLGHPAG
jgi:hypothetical protein